MEAVPMAPELGIEAGNVVRNVAETAGGDTVA
jgi:hypothetical protein